MENIIGTDNFDGSTRCSITFTTLFLAWHPTNDGGSIHQLYLYFVDISCLYF